MEESSWILQLLGRLHPLAVHFPIGLLVVALFFESLTIGDKRQSLRAGIRLMVLLGAIFAVLSAVLGWLLFTQDDYTGELVQNHRNIGIATAILAIITTLLLRATRKGRLPNFFIYRIGLFVTVVVLTIAGHLGTTLTHGEDYLTSVFPREKTPYDDGKTTELLSQLKSLDTLTIPQKDELNLGVRAIFAHNCYQCHNENKRKGGLVLDSKRGVYKGGESGQIIFAGKPEESELFKRISLPADHDDVMPKKGKVLKDDEISLVELWIENGAHWSDRALRVFPEAELALTKPVLPKNSTESHPLDKLIDVYFQGIDTSWPEVVNDRIFIRRVYLDIIGLLPEPEVISEFIQDKNANKRNELIERLLSDNHNYTQHWLSFWNDLLRNDYSGPGFITGGRKQITNWLYSSLEQNKPYDQMVKELIDPTDESEGFIKGIEWRGVVNESQRTEMQAAQNIGQSLLGVNVKCASCHNSFVSNLTLEQSYGFAAIFADSLLELNRCDQPLGRMAKANFLYPELGSVDAETVMERLSLLSEVMTKPENGRMYRTLVNRVWKELLGRGIVEPVDEMDNNPWDSSVLDWLASDFIDSGFDMKHLMKRILTSKTYQLNAYGYDKQEDLRSDYVFRGPVVRRLSAEQFSDAVSQFVAPMYHAVAFNPSEDNMASNRIWHREIKFDRTVLPEPGKRYFRQQIEVPDKALKKAIVLISVDHSYRLFINGKNIAEGSDWRKVEKLDVVGFLNKGKNVLAIEAVNEDGIANPAGILFAMRFYFEDGEEVDIGSDKKWKTTDEAPEEGWMKLDFNDMAWAKPQNYGTSNWGKLLDFSFEQNESEFARASLVQQHPFMMALGRPSRENVTTSRDDQATLLQALELTNGEYFNSVLEEGATVWLDKYGGNAQEIVQTLYQKALGRKPSAKEEKIMLSALGDSPKNEALQDLFWSTLILPEFQFVY